MAKSNSSSNKSRKATAKTETKTKNKTSTTTTNRTTDPINSKIKLLTQWHKAHPNIRVTKRGTMDDELTIKLADYCKGSTQKLSDLFDEYIKLQDCYEFVLKQDRNKKLTVKQRNACREADLGSRFGYPSDVYTLANKYRLAPRKIDYVIKKYEKFDNFIEAYKNDRLDDTDKYMFNYNLKKVFNHSGNNNRNLDALYIAVQDQSNCLMTDTECNLYIYDATLFTKALNELASDESFVLHKKYGIRGGDKLLTLEISSEDVDDTYDINLKKGKVKQIEARALKNLRSKLKPNTISCIINHKTDETVQGFIDEIWQSNLIFIPDKEYSNIPDEKFDYDAFTEAINDIKEKRTAKAMQERYAGTFFETDPIETLAMSQKALNILSKKDIKTIGDFNFLSYQDISTLPKAPKNIIDELIKVKDSINLTPTDDDKTQLETLREKKISLQHEDSILKERVNEAEQLFQSYVDMLGDNKSE